MARQIEDFWDEDECCLSCGTLNYRESRTPGICVSCAESGTDLSELSLFESVSYYPVSEEELLGEFRDFGSDMIIINGESDWFSLD